ncbi:cellulose biosynthesis protein BcsD [Variovorax ginsengisoli]|uniref:cellulose biosynthesis protein BcsD n=1 Tax=Variovorax ginsengisoli TaxID=363844 RepID=UPI0027D90870|nr:cellulose biosynthesis protein BcsD [Variovorax ginsengisoli]
MTSTDSLLGYYERNACSPQWLEFNRGLALELSAGLPSEEIRALFKRIGSHMAQAMPLARCDSLQELQAEFNARWASIAWGFSSLREEEDFLEIIHACSPLAVAFGPASSEWISGFFEGAYQVWFAAQGIPSVLRVRAEEPAITSAASQIVLRLSRVHP